MLNGAFWGIETPIFTTRGAPWCGPDCAEMIARHHGRQFPWVKPLVPQLTFSSTMVDNLSQCELLAQVAQVSCNDRRHFLQHKLRLGVPTALWIRSAKYVPLYAHVVVVTGFRDTSKGRIYFMMDPRKGVTESWDRCLYSGNKIYTEEYLFSVWKNLPWSKTALAVFVE